MRPTGLRNKVVIVTGAAAGIGRATALRFAEEGSRLAAWDVNAAAAGNLVEQLESAGAEALFREVNVTSAESIQSGLDEVLNRWGRVDVLVNNAGIALDQLVMRMKDDDWNRSLAVNLTGNFNLIRAVARPMMKAKKGAIVNVTSVIGEMGNAGQAAYAAAKAGQIGLTKSVARELASRNIRVNAVAPGFIETDMTAGLTEAAKTKMMELIPLARLGSAEDVANAVAFLASDQASYVTGEVLRVNGGMYM